MADEDDTKKQKGSKAKKSSESGILLWIIMAVVVVVCAGAGFGLGRLFASFSLPETTESSQESKPAQPKNQKANDSATSSNNNWYCDLEPVVANLDEPGVTRYVRATIMLEISAALAQDKGEKLLEEKKPILINWLTIYLASLTLEDTRGDRNLKRIQSQILDAFNEKLFPDAKPQIKHILFKEFAIQ